MNKHSISILLNLTLVAYLLLGCVLSNPPPTTTGRSTHTPTPATGTPSPTATIRSTHTPAPATETPPPTTTVRPTNAAAQWWDWNDLSLYKRAMRPQFAADVERFATATRYAIDLNIDLNTLTLRGVAHVRYTNHETEPLHEIVFRLLPHTPSFGGNMQVRQVTLNDQPASFDLKWQGSAIYVPLDEPLLPNRAIDLALTFDDTLPADDLAGYAQYGYMNDVLALPNAYPMIPVYDDEGWNVELSPSYGDATFSDTALYLVRVTLAAEMIPAVSGVIVDQQDNPDGTTTYTCASGPMRDFNIVASRHYQTMSEQVGQILITSYYMPGDEKGSQLILDYTVHALDFYQEQFGPYPFNELDVMATPTQAGGIEYPGMYVAAQHLYDRVGGFFEMVAVHETAHQWWYSLVGNDQIDEPWLDESLTQYASLLYFEHRYGDDVAQSILQDSFEGWYKSLGEQEQKIAVGLPVAAYNEHTYGAIVYGKGPLFFHALRQRVGDKAFGEILHAYFQQYRYDIAYPQDFIDLAEQVSGQQLDTLYDTWILGH